MKVTRHLASFVERAGDVPERKVAKRSLRGGAAANIGRNFRIVVAGDPNHVGFLGHPQNAVAIHGIEPVGTAAIMETVPKRDELPGPVLRQNRAEDGES